MENHFNIDLDRLFFGCNVKVIVIFFLGGGVWPAMRFEEKFGKMKKIVKTGVNSVNT